MSLHRQLIIENRALLRAGLFQVLFLSTMPVPVIIVSVLEYQFPVNILCNLSSLVYPRYIIFNATVNKGKTSLLIRNTYFGETANVFINAINRKDSAIFERYSSKILSDISLEYTPRSWLTIALGVNNVFDVYPDPIRNYINTSEGILIYCNEASPFGFNGGYYFINTSFRF